MPAPCIAIVDDNESVLRALSRMIRSLGMESGTFSSAAEFLTACQNESLPKLDCLILDVQMPGMPGLELLQLLQKSAFRQPVIMISAHDDPLAQQKALAVGAIAFLRKPFKDELLISTLYEALELDREALD